MVNGRFRALANAACIGMLLVLLAGALVTNTDSGAGCGTDWPLCNGKFVPAYTIESMIEYSHRLISGLEGLLVLGVFILVFQKYRMNKAAFTEPLWYAGSSLFFIIVQALMGAAAVIWYQSPAVMAIHFGISLMAFAATLLVVIWIYRTRNGEPAPFIVPRSVLPRAMMTSIFCYIVVYLGAYIRHTESSGGCLDWPLCNGQIIPELSGATGAVFIHRVSAIILAILIIDLYVHVRKVMGKEGGMRKSTGWVLVCVLTQILSGAWLTWTLGNNEWFLFTSLFHNVIVTVMFGILVDLVIRSWRFRTKR